MKHYPTIPTMNQHPLVPDVDFYFFEKLDGSNIRAEWSPKKGFFKFGTRKRLLGEDDPQFGEAIGLIKRQEPVLGGIFTKNKFERAVAFFEFYGPGSFAGFHLDEPHQVALLDVDVYKNGFLPPSRLVELFDGQVPTPRLVHRGKITEAIVGQVKNGSFPGASFEGVVCKADITKKWAPPLMIKIKNQAWIDAVKSKYPGNEDLL